MLLTDMQAGENAMKFRQIFAAGVSIAALVLFFVYHFVSASFTDENSNDPNWSNTHLSTESESEALDLFGEDLYISEFSDFVKELDRAECKISYELEFDKGGSVAEKSTWTSLTMDAIGNRENWTFSVFFDSEDPRIHELLPGSAREIVINAVPVSYVCDENLTFEAAVFEMNEQTFYLFCDRHTPAVTQDSEVLRFIEYMG